MNQANSKLAEIHLSRNFFRRFDFSVTRETGPVKSPGLWTFLENVNTRGLLTAPTPMADRLLGQLPEQRRAIPYLFPSLLQELFRPPARCWICGYFEQARVLKLEQALKLLDSLPGCQTVFKKKLALQYSSQRKNISGSLDMNPFEIRQRFGWLLLGQRNHAELIVG